MNLKRRRGFALIWVVLIGALIFVGIVSLTLRIVPENMITVARTHNQRALAVAEDGTSQVLFDLRNFGTSADPNYINEFDPNSGSSHYLTTGNVITLINASSGTIVPAANPSPFITNPTPLSDESFETSYKAKIKVISNDTTNKILKVDLYTLGTVTDRVNGNVLARKAIKTRFLVDYIIPQPGWKDGTNSSVFDYALFSGDSIIFNGDAQTVDGNIHAIGLIDLGQQPKVRVKKGDSEKEANAETEDSFVVYEKKGIDVGGTVDGDKLDPNTSPPAPTIPFPGVDIPAYETLANAFKTGTVPFDGSQTASGYPNANSLFFDFKLAIQTYLGAPGTSSTVSGIQDFYTNLMAGTGEFSLANVKDPVALKNLQDNIKAAVFYVDADSPLNGGNGNGEIQSGEEIKINGNYSFQGTIVINGTLTLNGNATIGDVNNSGGSAILVNGNIDTSKLTGTAALYGAYYSNGSITGKGTFDCYGSIVTKGSMDLNGSYNVTYVPINNPNLGISTPGQVIPATGGPFITSAASGTSSYSWKEISYDGFVNAE